MIALQKYSGPDIKTILAEKGLDGNDNLWQNRLKKMRASDIEKALSHPAGTYSMEKLAALVSPAAEDYLEDMAQLAHQLTKQRFGRTIRLYAPLYLSNFCINSCRYCGFNKDNKSERTRLNINKAAAEADIIASVGFRDILLVSSEDRDFITIDYLAELAKKLRSKFSSISIEVYPMNISEYVTLFEAGIEGVTLYQETYNRKAYQYYHSGGPKSDYDSRLSRPENIATAGMREIGIGSLLGLANWRIETLAIGEHVHYLTKRYWQSHVSISFPRLRPAHEVEFLRFKHLLNDKNLVQMVTALRLCFADVGLVLSTRERAELRDHLIVLGITKMSAGSRTSPGGYSWPTNEIRQFEIDDMRSPSQVADMIKAQGYEPVWKDWDSAFIDIRPRY